ncbi:class V aminotransferase [Novosphingobium sp. ZN18A2]|uniref:class V aminotransferase n=1 Tax=Novosphingobium sp. ZN18A2 TaxID=3079861 RepID=UPI0030CE2EF5
MTGESFRRLFQRAIAAAPDRLHLAAHSHHLWPDASWLGQQAAWDDAARLADRKWDRVMGEIWPGAQRHVAAELGLPDPATVVFAPNTHDLIVRLVSAHPGKRPLRVLASDGEFHSFRRQAARWVEASEIVLETVPVAGNDFTGRFVERARTGQWDLIFTSHVMFGSGGVFEGVDELAALSGPDGPWVAIDGYHGFMAVETDLSAVADRVFYLAGGYKYAMAGEGCAFMHCPPGFGPRPAITGWYAAFDDLSLPPGTVGYATDARRFMGATFDPSGLYRFVAVRDMLAQEGLTTARISAHVAALRDDLLARIAHTPLSQADVLNPPGHGAQARFLAFRSPHAAQWQARLLEQEVVTDVRGDVLRIGLGLYHDARDMARAGDVLARL